MIKNILLGILHFVLLVSIQVFVLNNINIAYINPMLYIWFVLMLPVNTPRWGVLLSSFAVGFAVDMFAGETGFHTAITVFIGFIRQIFINIYFSGKDTDSSIRPSIMEMGLRSFLFYTTILVFIHHFLYFNLEIFNFSEFFLTLLRIIISTISTVVLIVICDLLFLRLK